MGKSTLVCIDEALRRNHETASKCRGVVKLCAWVEPDPNYPNGVVKLGSLCQECRIIYWAWPVGWDNIEQSLLGDSFKCE